VDTLTSAIVATSSAEQLHRVGRFLLKLIEAALLWCLRGRHHRIDVPRRNRSPMKWSCEVFA
jgi:hypothetical protein